MTDRASVRKQIQDVDVTPPIHFFPLNKYINYLFSYYFKCGLINIK